MLIISDRNRYKLFDSLDLLLGIGLIFFSIFIFKKKWKVFVEFMKLLIVVFVFEEIKENFELCFIECL